MREDIDHDRRRFVGTAAMTIAAARLGIIASMVEQVACAARRLPIEGELSSLDTATGWLNSPALTTEGLRGRVVVVDFWTYTCINWLRTLPYVRAWAGKYKEQGLVVIGVHAPEFSFEKDIDNVRRETKRMRVDYPVAIDSEHAIWRAFRNEYWPALYFVDAKGHVRHHQFGEGNYEQSEKVIQQLLAEAGTRAVSRDLVSVEGGGTEAGADWGRLRSAETYCGYDRAENLVSPGGALYDERRVYTAPAQLRLNQWALVGDWTVKREPALLNETGGGIVYQFHARDLHLVMGSANRGALIPFRVAVDGKPPGAAHGLDVDAQGLGVLSDQRLYQLIRQPKAIEDRRFEIQFLDSGAEVFCFTFG